MITTRVRNDALVGAGLASSLIAIGVFLQFLSSGMSDNVVFIALFLLPSAIVGLGIGALIGLFVDIVMPLKERPSKALPARKPVFQTAALPQFIRLTLVLAVVGAGLGMAIACVFGVGLIFDALNSRSSPGHEEIVANTGRGVMFISIVGSFGGALVGAAIALCIGTWSGAVTFLKQLRP